MSAPNTMRQHGLDALRGLAVLLMVEQHMGVWLWSRRLNPADVASMWPLLKGFNALGGGAAPTFIALAGLGTSFLIAHRPGPGLDSLILRRGLALWCFGIALNFAAPSWFSWGSWFVLHLMAFATVVAPGWRRLSDRALGGLAVVVLATTPVVQTWLDTPARLSNPRMANVDLPGGALRLAMAEGQFPVLPWLAVFLFGALAGRWVLQGRTRDVAVLGASLMGFGASAFAALHLMPRALRPALAVRAFDLHVGFFPASVSIVCLLAGLAVLAIAGVVVWERRRPWSAANPLVCLGRASLTLLMIHVPLFREFTRRPIPGVTKYPVWQALDAGTTLLVIGGFLALSMVAVRSWRHVQFRGGAEWLLRLLSSRGWSV